MEYEVYQTKLLLGRAAANDAAELISSAIVERSAANIILATGASQFETLAHLVKTPDIAWEKVTMFHLDEYIGLPGTHPASFRRYLKERFIDKVGPLKAVHLVDGNAPDPQNECGRLSQLIAAYEIDVALVGIGENGHLAFNDPPADFDTDRPFIIVDLDEACRRQQLGEGWFGSLEQVPQRAISMSIRQILKSRAIICSVPDRRKAEAVRAVIRGPVTNMVPASILQRHGRCKIYLDTESAAFLE